MFLEVPNIYRAKRIAFERIKNLARVKSVKLYPINENLVFVLKGDDYDKIGLKGAKALRKFLENEGVSILVLPHRDKNSVYVFVLNSGELKIYEFEKSKEPLLVFFTSNEISSLDGDEIPVYVLEEDEENLNLLEETISIVKDINPEIGRKLALSPISVKIKEEDYNDIIKEVSLKDLILQYKNKIPIEKINKKKIIVGALIISSFYIGVLGYKHYKGEKEQEDFKRKVVNTNKNKVINYSGYNLNIMYFLKKMPFLYASIHGIDFAGYTYRPVKGFNYQKINDYYYISGEISIRNNETKVSGKPFKKDLLPVPPNLYLDKGPNKFIVYNNLPKKDLDNVLEYLSKVKDYQIKSVSYHRLFNNSNYLSIKLQGVKNGERNP